MEKKGMAKTQKTTNRQMHKERESCCFLYLQPFMTIRTSSETEKGERFQDITAVSCSREGKPHQQHVTQH